MMVTLPELCTIQYGYAFDSADFTEDESYPPIVRIRDVKRGYSETYFSGKYPEEYILHSGDLLIGMDGEFNIARWKSRDALLNQRVCRVSAKAGTDEEWLRFALSKALKSIEDRTSFVTVKHLSAKELNKLELNTPDFRTQTEIAHTLSSIEKIIELRETQLTILDDLIKARFVEMFGDPISNPMKWDYYQLGDCLERIDNGRSFVCADKPRKGINPAVLKLSAATYGDYRPNENKALLDESLFVESAEVHSGDLLFTRKNPPELVGMAAYVHETPPNLMMPDLIFRLVPNERMRAVFLWQLINCKEFRPVIQAISGGSAKSMSNISKERLGKIMVICPPKERQDAIIPFIQQINKSKDAVKKSLEETQFLFDSLMQKYFGQGGEQYGERK